jgi:hypothetical protein
LVALQYEVSNRFQTLDTGVIYFYRSASDTVAPVKTSSSKPPGKI